MTEYDVYFLCGVVGYIVIGILTVPAVAFFDARIQPNYYHRDDESPPVWIYIVWPFPWIIMFWFVIIGFFGKVPHRFYQTCYNYFKPAKKEDTEDN